VTNLCRLAGGSSDHLYAWGRVEVFFAGQWGTVCDDGFGWHEANAFCRALGHVSAVGYYHRAAYGSGVGPIWLDDVTCPSCASVIEHCSHSGAGRHNCGHDEDVSVKCLRYRGDCRV